VIIAFDKESISKHGTTIAFDPFIAAGTLSLTMAVRNVLQSPCGIANRRNNARLDLSNLFSAFLMFCQKYILSRS
jgi:hypothetical protein